MMTLTLYFKNILRIFFCTDEKLFELFCIENDFAKYFAIFIDIFYFAHYYNFSK